jgi:hypothetical protein
MQAGEPECGSTDSPMWCPPTTLPFPGGPCHSQCRGASSRLFGRTRVWLTSRASGSRIVGRQRGGSPPEASFGHCGLGSGGRLAPTGRRRARTCSVVASAQRAGDRPGDTVLSSTPTGPRRSRLRSARPGSSRRCRGEMSPPGVFQVPTGLLTAAPAPVERFNKGDMRVREVGEAELIPIAVDIGER